MSSQVLSAQQHRAVRVWVRLRASDAARNITGCLFPVDGGTMPY